jgi:hypothetical protein
MIKTIEDVILKINEIDLVKSDKQVLLSLRSQVLKNVALTDRQYELAKEKLVKYESELYAVGISDLPTAMSTLGSPIRYIDRAKTITIVDNVNFNNLALPLLSRSSATYIKIDFPFNKKTIAVIDKIARSNTSSGYVHPRGAKSHYFPLTELNIEIVIDAFKDRNFDIDQELIDNAAAIEEIKTTKSLFVPGIYNNQMLNLKPAAMELISEEISLDDPNRLIKLCDRRFRYGLDHVDLATDTLDPTSVLSDIISRTAPLVEMELTDCNIVETSAALSTLDHFPILVLVDGKSALKQITMMHQAFPNIDNATQSVLFREPSGDGDLVNTYIKENNLNNWVDDTTKIVYINKKKLPKILLKSNWKPRCAISFSEQRSCEHIRIYAAQHADLIIRPK